MHRLILLAFLSPSCPHCTAQKPALQQIANERPDVLVQTVDTSVDLQAARSWLGTFGMSGVPALFICRVRPMGAPAEVLDHMSGNHPAPLLHQKLNALLQQA